LIAHTFLAPSKKHDDWEEGARNRAKAHENELEQGDCPKTSRILERITCALTESPRHLNDVNLFASGRQNGKYRGVKKGFTRDGGACLSSFSIISSSLVPPSIIFLFTTGSDSKKISIIQVQTQDF
jgi:hypothetical protein